MAGIGLNFHVGKKSIDAGKWPLNAIEDFPRILRDSQGFSGILRDSQGLPGFLRVPVFRDDAAIDSFINCN